MVYLLLRRVLLLVLQKYLLLKNKARHRAQNNSTLLNQMTENALSYSFIL